MSIIPHSRPTLNEEEIEAIGKVVKRGEIACGEEVKKLEESFSQFTGRKYSVALNSGTSSLFLALYALGLGEKDKVIIPSYTCSALLHAVLQLKAHPIVVDISPEDLQLDAEKMKENLSPDVKAIILPHMFGIVARVENYLIPGVYLIEDCAQALGAKRGGKKGIMTVYSFYATKLITTGEGGMITTDQEKIAEDLKDLREYDKKNSFRLRFNMKMSDLQASLGRVQLKKLPFFLERRQEIAKFYHSYFLKKGLTSPSCTVRENIFYRYLIKVKEDKLPQIQEEFLKEGIECKRPVFLPLHRYLNLKDSFFPHTSEAYNSLLSLPIYPSLKDSEVERVVEVAKRIFGK